MPYYNDVPMYYYGGGGGAFANHSSLITGRTPFHTAHLSRFSPHLSTISESSLNHLHRFSPISVRHPRRVIDTADIDVSSPRILTHDGNRPRNRLRRDRPTIKIRSQALKDNPALREHYEKHEKSVGELLMEKFFIKNKKQESAEQVRLYRQVSLDDESREKHESNNVQKGITRRLTRRRSSADLNPEQLQREATYAQVQAKVLDSLVAEEQAQIKNEARRGTLIKKKGTTPKRPKGTKDAGHDTNDSATNVSSDTQTQEEDGGKDDGDDEDAAAARRRKTIKKAKRKKKPDKMDDRRSSTSSEMSTESQIEEWRREEKENEDEDDGPKMYKIEACNSTGDFSTIWINANSENAEKHGSERAEEFRESVRIPVPRKAKQVDNKETEARIVLSARKPYVKDTSRNSVYLTVKKPTGKLDDAINQVGSKDCRKDDTELTNGECKVTSTSVGRHIDSPTNKLKEAPREIESSSWKEAHRGGTVRSKAKSYVEPRSVDAPPSPKNAASGTAMNSSCSIQPSVSASFERVSTGKDKAEIIEQSTVACEAAIDATTENDTASSKCPKVVSTVGTSSSVCASKPPVVSKTRDNLEIESGTTTSRDEDATRGSAAPSSTSSSIEAASSATLASKSVTASGRLPKPSKINADGNNAVQAPELSLRETEAEYLANPPKSVEDVEEKTAGKTLPGKKANKAWNLARFPSSDTLSTANGVDVVASKSTLNMDAIRRDDAAKSKSEETTTLLKETTGKVRSNDRHDEKAELPVKPPPPTTKVSRDQRVGQMNENVAGIEGSAVVTSREANQPSVSREIGETSSGKAHVAKDSRRPFSPKSKPITPSGVESKWLPKVTTLPKTCVDKMSSVVSSADRSSNLNTSISSSKLNAPPSKRLETRKKLVVDDAICDKSQEEGRLSKSASTESIDFWSEIKAPGSPEVTRLKQRNDIFSYEAGIPADEKTDPPKWISSDSPANVGAALDGEEQREPGKKAKARETEAKRQGNVTSEIGKEKREIETEKPTTARRVLPKRKKNNNNDLSIAIDGKDSSNRIVKKGPLKRDDSAESTVDRVIVPLINVVEAPKLPDEPDDAKTRNLADEEEHEDPSTPTNELPAEPSFARKISKWSNQHDLTNVDDVETPLASEETSLAASPTISPQSSKTKRPMKKKKPSTKKAPSSSNDEKEAKGSIREVDAKTTLAEKQSLPKPKTSPKTSPRNLSPARQRPLDLIRMFYTTPSALLTATPRDLSKVKRAKIKRRRHHSRTPSVSSDSTGSTTSTATESTDGSGSTCTELDDDPERKRINSIRSNDSGFDGSPRISNCDMACHKKCEKLTGNLCGLNQKLVAEALQALKKAPSQSTSDNQRNSDSLDHLTSGRITPPATNLPRFKKYAVTDFNFLKVLGKGSFGKVLLAELRGTECVYAVKCLKKDVVLEDDDVECTLIERKVLTLATRHPYLCHLFCTFQTESHLFFVMEYLNGGDLMFHIQKSGRFPEIRARFYAAEIWSGLNFLHKKGIVYRDLKLDNVLLDFEGHIRIADFGMCKLQIFLDRTADTFCGTPDYMAPEIIKGLKYNQAVDWWSYGVLLYEMLTGQSPFSGCDEDELFWSICNERPFIPRYLSQEATDILVCLLEKDSGKRPPGHEIAMHAFFQQLPWDRLERRQVEPPFKPALDHTLDTKYFDTAFTAERPRLTPVPEQILTLMDQGVFRGFSYTNPNATD